MSLSTAIIPSPLGDLFAIASDAQLIMLEFADSKGREKKIQKIGSANITQWENAILEQTRSELREYFEWKRKTFDIPLAPEGTVFQKQAWKALERIPYGETRSYKEEAILAWNPKAVRAIGGANNKNPIVIVVPCHRVIWADGSLVGYGGGMERKIWLLGHERKHIV